MISLRDLANPFVLDLVPYEPGKPVEDVARELGLEPGQIIKLASNENPLGPSPAAARAVREAAADIHFYPDGGAYHLRNAIAERVGLQRENVVLGNGSNEIILLLFQAFVRTGVHEIVVPQCSFSVYELAAQLFGVNCIQVANKEGFEPDLDALLAAITPQTRLVFLANPNNPTGVRVPNDRLLDFLHRLPEHVVCGLDEAYYEFLDDAPDTVALVRENAKVCVMRTFSKIQGLAGLRVGYGLASAELADVLQRSRQPFNVNSLALAGALAALGDPDHERRTKQLTDEGRTRLEAGFAELNLPFVPSAGNFVLVKVGDGGAVFRHLLKRGVIVRPMKGYDLPEWVRVSIGTAEQNERFLKELPYALRGEQPPFPVPDPPVVKEEPVAPAVAVEPARPEPETPAPAVPAAPKPEAEKPAPAASQPEPVVEAEPERHPEPEAIEEPMEEPAAPSSLFEPVPEPEKPEASAPAPEPEPVAAEETIPAPEPEPEDQSEPETKPEPVIEPEPAPEPEVPAEPADKGHVRVEVEDRASGRFREADRPRGLFGTIRNALRSLFGG